MSLDMNSQTRRLGGLVILASCLVARLLARSSLARSLTRSGRRTVMVAAAAPTTATTTLARSLGVTGQIRRG